MVEVPGNEAQEGSSSAVSRRTALKRGAVVGGTLLWVTPAVQVIGLGSANAQQSSGGGGVTPTTVVAPTTTTPAPTTTTTMAPELMGISFVAFRFTCGSTTYFVKQDIGGGCDGPNNSSTENCGVNVNNAQSGCGLGLFTLSNQIFNDENELVGVTVNLTCAAGNIAEGSAKSGAKCVTASLNGASATFAGAPK